MSNNDEQTMIRISNRLDQIEGKLDNLTAMMAEMMGEDHGKS